MLCKSAIHHRPLIIIFILIGHTPNTFSPTIATLGHIEEICVFVCF